MCVRVDVMRTVHSMSTTASTTKATDYRADMVTVSKLCKGLGVLCRPPLSCGARRNLFGVGVEQKRITEQLAEQVFELAERSSRNWNFDFTHESPLPGGRYVWEKVPETDVPRWYIHESVPLKSLTEVRRQYHLEKENAPLRRRHSLNEKSKKTLHQTSIKGFSRVQKRRPLLRSKSKTSVFVRGPSLVADYLLDSVGSSQCS